ncbi:MAG: lytic murein transglycosylase [Robiginitomaculum sp.]|nr:MAG: lytic murein transglycosylase [Robiginitomaculum sp.]
MWRLKVFGLGCVISALGACATMETPAPIPPAPQHTPEDPPIVIPEPEIEPETEPQTPILPPAPPLIVDPEPDVQTQNENMFVDLEFWADTDLEPALQAFVKSCGVWARRKDEARLHKTVSEYGQYKDWREVCQKAVGAEPGSDPAREFFQTWFAPIALQGKENTKPGLLTAYYAPEIEVRLQPDAEFSEPVLARPTDEKTRTLPRKSLNAGSSKVLAYGRPIDVFFLQIQGSGRIQFKDGTRYMAAFNGHNSQKYKSIGRVLITRGEMTRTEASKQAIEDWMAKAGPEATRALMNENPRYIFFKTEHLIEGLGPRGAMGVPLTNMGSLAVDPRFHPYGALIWLNTTLPQKADDFIGKPAGALVVAQDTGSAIKGAKRGDMYFGAGLDAGARAGVMKHKAGWTYVLPCALAEDVQLALEAPALEIPALETSVHEDSDPEDSKENTKENTKEDHEPET